MNIWGIDMGHPDGCGANGFMSETDGNRAVGRILISKLQALGDTVVDCTVDDNNNELERRVAKANAQHLDYFISLHMDCYNNPQANGATIYTTEGSSAKGKAQEIIDLVAASCGYYNRGWKSANFYVLRDTNAPAMLIEMGFVSNQGDCNKFNAESIANAITKGLTGQTVSLANEQDKINQARIEKEKLDEYNAKYKLESDTDMTKIFSANYYKAMNPDVVKAYGSEEKALYKHYIDYGKTEGRLGVPPLPKDFSVFGYLQCNEDLQEAFNNNTLINVLNHYFDYGFAENRAYVYIPPVVKEQIIDDSVKETFYRVVTGSYKERPNADDQIAKLKASGFDSFVDIFKK